MNKIRRVRLSEQFRSPLSRSDKTIPLTSPSPEVATLLETHTTITGLVYDRNNSLIFTTATEIFRLRLPSAAARSGHYFCLPGASISATQLCDDWLAQRSERSSSSRAPPPRSKSGAVVSGPMKDSALLVPELVAGPDVSSKSDALGLGRQGTCPRRTDSCRSLGVPGTSELAGAVYGRFSEITGLVADTEGSGDLYVLDLISEEDVTHVHRLSLTPVAAASGAASGGGVGGGGGSSALPPTLTRLLGLELDGTACCPAILPNGYLAVCTITTPGAVRVLDLGLSPRPAGGDSGGRVGGLGGGGAGAGGDWCRRRSLSADLGALLTAQPDATSDVEVQVGGRRFAVHRAVLAARCDYFRQRLAPDGFADGSSACLTLDDASAEAFSLVLQYLYTGHHESFPDDQLQAVAELADRLLLPELCAAAQVRLMEGVGAEGVVDLMGWAETRGPAFAGLQAALKAWYLDHHMEVLEASPEAVKRLMVASPDLAFELHMATARLAGGWRA